LKSFLLLVHKIKDELQSVKSYELKTLPFEIGDSGSVSDEGKIPSGNHVLDVVYVESQ
jgi:hypothetical protein